MDPPPPRQTRKQIFTSGSLSTGRTKDNMLANPSHTSNINNPTQAKIFLINKALLPDNRDPAHPNLSKALLDLTFTGSGINAITADALRAVAILLDDYLSSTPSTPPLPRHPPSPTQLDGGPPKPNKLKKPPVPVLSQP